MRGYNTFLSESWVGRISFPVWLQCASVLVDHDCRPSEARTGQVFRDCGHHHQCLLTIFHRKVLIIMDKAGRNDIHPVGLIHALSYHFCAIPVAYDRMLLSECNRLDRFVDSQIALTFVPLYTVRLNFKLNMCRGLVVFKNCVFIDFCFNPSSSPSNHVFHHRFYAFLSSTV